MRKPVYVLSLLLLLGACRTGAKSAASNAHKFKAPAGDSSAVVVGFDTLGVTKNQVDKLLQPAMMQIAQMAQQQGVTFDQAATTFRQQATTQILIQSLVDRESKRLKLEVEPRKLDSIVKLVLGQFPDTAQMMAALSRSGQTPASVRENIAKQMLQQKVFESVYADSLKVPAARVDSFYQANKDRMGGGAKVRGRHILKLSKGPEDSAKAHASILKLYEKLKASDLQFGALAKAESEDPGTKDKGGDLGWFNPKEMVPEFAAAAEKLEPGKVSEPIRTQYGWHILQIQDRKSGSSPSLDSLRPQIEEMLKGEAMNRLGKSFVRSLAKTYKVEFVDPSYKLSELFDEEAPKPVVPMGAMPAPVKEGAPMPAPASSVK